MFLIALDTLIYRELSRNVIKIPFEALPRDLGYSMHVHSNVHLCIYNYYATILQQTYLSHIS